MNSKRSIKITFLLTLLLFTVSIAAQHAEIPLKEGNKFPNFELNLLDGENFSSDSLKGKVTFINLWFTACIPCIEEMPELNKLVEAYKDKVQFLSITFDDIEKVQLFLNKIDFNFKHIIHANKFIKDELKNISFPKNIIIDKTGKIVLVNDGLPFTRDQASGEMKPLPYTYFGKHLDKVIGE
jgi:thiol-disulfide isomerase/thioredoxin